MGQTRVLAQVHGPHEVDDKRDDSHAKAKLHVEYCQAPFASLERKRRRGGDRQGVELALSVKESLEAAVLVDLYPHTQIDIFITVLQDDGGRLPACLNAAGLAIIDAGISMRDVLVSCSAGMIGGEAMVDLQFREQTGDGGFLPLALLPSQDKVVLAQMSGAKLPLDDAEMVLQAAVSGCHQVHSVLKQAVLNHAEFLLNAQGGVRSSSKSADSDFALWRPKRGRGGRARRCCPGMNQHTRRAKLYKPHITQKKKKKKKKAAAVNDTQGPEQGDPLF
eukprot:FR743816.1.p1 GENE.FR743816.1~~FR743816.1.p1  ORF type:complete len:296 (+),score=44.04 FR743816.1:59-889(+)